MTDVRSRFAFAIVFASLTVTSVAPAPLAAAGGFGDVSADVYYEAPVQWLVDESITTGTTPGCFSPDRPVTRAETATFLWRYAGSPTLGTDSFLDVEPNAFFAQAVAWMATTGITTGTTPTTFSPDRPVTRAETATFLWRYAGSPTVTIRSGGACGGAPDPVTPTPPAGNRFETLAPGSVLPSGEQCARSVRAAVETRPDNTPYNTTTGRGPHPDIPRVDGDFTGTTDEILQWAACKWGIDEDVVRAQVVKESWWDQRNGGDLSNDPNNCHPSVRNLSPCPESLGILQVRYPYHGPAMDDAIASTAYNADYTYAVWRSCYEGELTWLNTVERGATYHAGDLWGCLGVWFSGRWRTADAVGYIAAVGDLLDGRVWEQASFVG